MIWQQLQSLAGSYPLALRGLGMTVMLSLISLVLGTLIGFGLGILRTGGNRRSASAIGAWVDLIRGTPFLVQIFLIFFILPEFGIELDAFTAGIIALTNLAACFICEIVAAGIRSVPTGQVEAALASGLSRWQRMRQVVLPQAMRIVLPPLVGQYVLLIKDFLRRLGDRADRPHPRRLAGRAARAQRPAGLRPRRPRLFHRLLSADHAGPPARDAAWARAHGEVQLDEPKAANSYQGRRSRHDRVSRRQQMVRTRFNVLKDITLSVEPREVVVVCGPSGSGKSTLIRCINGLEAIKDGDLVVDGQRARRPRHQHDAAAHRDRLRLPAVQPLPAQDRARERHAGADPCAQDPARRGREGRARTARQGRACRQGQRLSRRALRRPAAARGDRALPRHAARRSCCSTSRPRRSIPR